MTTPEVLARSSRPSSVRTASRHAFTLVELLCVIAIIGVLAAILLPTIAYAKAKSQDSRCASNLRQVGLVIHTYTVDNKSTFPPGGAWFKPYFNADPRNFQVALVPYLGLNATSSWGANIQYSALFDCPGYKGDVSTDSRYTLERYAFAEDGTTKIQPFGFTYQNLSNGKFETAPKPLKTAAVPAKNVVIRDRDYSATELNHAGYQNALYFDWRVARVATAN